MSDSIISGETVEYEIGFLPTYTEYHKKLIGLVFRKRRRGNPPPADLVKIEISAPAIVNHGRWMVRCPWCSGAEMLYLTKLQFLCLSCLNKDADGRFITIDLPPFHNAIEVQLLKRPIQFQNYEPGQTIEDLVKENNEHGWG